MVALRSFIGPVELKCVNFGVDTFLANFKLAGDDNNPNRDTLPEHIAGVLDAWQAGVRKDHKPVATPLEYRGKTVFIRPHGSGVWSWLLFNEDVTFSLSYGLMNGRVFCQARFVPHLLWSCGPEHALLDLERLLFDWTRTYSCLQ
jgi:hypothetical protein